MGIAILLIGYLGYLEYIKNLGYPDGHIIDYDLKMSITFKVMVLPVLSLSFYTFYLAVNSSLLNTSSSLKYCALLLLAGLALFFGLDLFFYHTVDHGQGG